MPSQDTSSIDIDYVAQLARIELTVEEKTQFAAQLKDILKYIEKLNPVDVVNVEPTAHPSPVYNVWREDKPFPGFSVDESLKNAPAQRDNQIVVPKVVE